MKNLLPLLLIVGFLLEGCSSFISKSPEVSFHNNNSLLPKIVFQTRDSSEVIIEYWPKEKPVRKQKSKPSNGKDHQIILLNVTPLTEYSFKIISKNGTDASEDYFFRTGEVPAEVLSLKKIKADSSQFNGYILVRRFFKSGADALINNEGEIVWYNLYDTAVRRAFAWTSNSTVLSIYDTARIVETNLFGERILDLDLPRLNVEQYVHHEILFDKDENIVTLTSDSALLDLRKFGGEKSQYLRGSGILKLNKKGEVLWKWSLTRDVDPMKLIDKTTNLKDMLGHANSIALCTDGNYLISFRDFSQIWKIDSSTGKVIWKLGKNGDFKMDEQSQFIRQHSIHFNNWGHLMMFDNGEYFTRPNSRVLSLSLDELNLTAKTEIAIQLSKGLSSYRMCSAYRIAEDKYLVCTTKKDLALTLVDREGKMLWKVMGDNASYRAYYIENPFVGEVFN